MLPMSSAPAAMPQGTAVLITVHIGCCLCSNEHKATIEMPEGWAHRYDAIDDETAGFCPDHSAVATFAESQCHGCVGGWGDCDMWKSFAYSGRQRTVSETDLATIACGICPRRTNGTFGVDARRGTIEDINLSDRAPVESGVAFAQAIREYITRYP